MIERAHVDIEGWIEDASANPVERRRRQAVEVLVRAISNTAELRKALYLKGGTLMNLVYGSPRMSDDVDFTVIAPPHTGFEQKIIEAFDREMDLAALDLGYTKLAFKVQKTEMKPADKEFPWPTFRMTIGIGEKNTPLERRLADGQAIHVLRLDISFNENVYAWQEVEIHNGTDNATDEENDTIILAYNIHELIAEKIRAVLQQTIRNRYRRQDIYDIARIVSIRAISEQDRKEILSILIAKCRDRDFLPSLESINDPELRKRSEKAYENLELDRGGTPLNFEQDYSFFTALYKSLPWGK